MAAVEYVSLRHLLEKGFSVGALATAVEDSGVFFWDLYGRFKLYKLESAEARSALKRLALEYARLEGPSEDDEDAPSGGSDDDLLDLCGWLPGELPDIAKLENSIPNVDRPRSGSKQHDNDLRIIAGLLGVIRGTLGTDAHPAFKTQSELVAWLEAKLTGFGGCSARNLEKKFSEANKLLDSWS
jgi:hypothetical protein